jgi:hypothetical protein
VPSVFLGKISDAATTALTGGLGGGYAASRARQQNSLNTYRKKGQKEGEKLDEATKAPIAVFSSKTHPTKTLLSDAPMTQDHLSLSASQSGLSLSRNSDDGTLQLQPAGADEPKMPVYLQQITRHHQPGYLTPYSSGDTLQDLMTHQAIRHFPLSEGQHSSQRVYKGTKLTVENVPKSGAAKDGVVALMHNIAGNEEKAHAIIGSTIPTGLTGMVFPDKNVVSNPNQNQPIDWPSAPLASPPAYNQGNSREYNIQV